MNIFINDETRQFKESKTITALVADLALEPKMVLIEHNGIALHRSEWSACILSEGDRIEILQVAAGG